MEVITWIVNNIGTIITGILAILGGASILAKLTPTEVDDKIIQKIIDIINMVALKK